VSPVVRKRQNERRCEIASVSVRTRREAEVRRTVRQHPSDLAGRVEGEVAHLVDELVEDPDDVDGVRRGAVAA
jgi:hypothetical protein